MHQPSVEYLQRSLEESTKQYIFTKTCKRKDINIDTHSNNMRKAFGFISASEAFRMFPFPNICNFIGKTVQVLAKN